MTRTRSLVRVLSGVIISLTGLGLSAIATRAFLSGVSGLSGGVIAGIVLLLGVAFLITGPAAYWTTIQSKHLLRIAGWNTLGVVATTAVLLLVGRFQTASGGNVTSPVLSGAVIVGVSAFAHVLIGFNDVRRIRAQTVATQREKAAVINRFVRHDLKQAAQLLIGYGEQISDSTAAQADGGVDLGQRIVDIGSDLSETQSQIKTVDQLLDADAERTTVSIEPWLRDQLTAYQDEYPAATVESDLAADLTVVAGEHLTVALEELLENAFVHSGTAPTVTVTSSRARESLRVEITNTGAAVPDEELSLINDGEVETQLEHSDGLGLWLAKWIIETYDGELTLRRETEPEGTTAMVTLPAAT